MVSCQKGPTRHAYTWQIGPFWQDTLDFSSAKFTRQLMSYYHDVLLSDHKAENLVHPGKSWANKSEFLKVKQWAGWVYVLSHGNELFDLKF